jgi:hypothetical protein
VWPAEAQVDAVVHQALAQHAPTDTPFDEQLDALLLKHAGADDRAVLERSFRAVTNDGGTVTELPVPASCHILPAHDVSSRG